MGSKVVNTDYWVVNKMTCANATVMQAGTIRLALTASRRNNSGIRAFAIVGDGR